MEGKKQMGSSSSLTSELFGSNESHPPPGSGIFESMFSPSSKVFGRESLRATMNEKTPSEGPNSKIGAPDYINKGSDGETQSTANKDMSSVYQEQRVQPCHLSSSIYYGGQDIYSHPHSTRDSGLNSMMGEKMIQEVLQEETGGKDLSIIKRTLAKGYAPQGK